MNSITGKVLLIESHEGVPDLLAVAFELDPKQDLSEQSAATKVFIAPENLIDILDYAGSEKIPQDIECWMPRRLGSVITDQAGSFKIEWREQVSKSKDESSKDRPDIVLFVMVPDQTDGKTAKGRSAKERVVYHTHHIRFGAGPVESFVILLSRQELVDHGFEPQRGPGTVSALSAESVAARLNREQQRTDKLAKLRAPLISKRMQRVDDERSVVSGLMEKISRGVKGPNRWYLPPSEIRFNGGGYSSENLSNRVLNGIESLVERLGYQPESDLTTSALLHLTPNEVTAIGLDHDQLKAGNAQNTSLCPVLKQIGAPWGLLRSRSLLTEVNAQRAVTALSVVPMPDAVRQAFPWMSGTGWAQLSADERAAMTEQASRILADGEQEQRSGTTADEVKSAVFDRLAAQVSQLPQLEGLASGGAANELSRVKAVVDQLELSGGPANVVASRDVNVLQLGFEWVWTNIFDLNFQEEVRKLYDHVVQLEQQQGVSLSSEAFKSVSSADDLRRNLRNIKRAFEVAEDQPLPEEVARLFPFVTREVWARLDPEGQEALLKLATEHNMDALDAAQHGTPRPDTPDEEAHQIIEAHSWRGASELIAGLEKRLAQPYSFDVFAPGHVNYGVMLTYRQQWSPVTYQVGELVETLPLAPGETREFRVKRETTERTRRQTTESRLRETSQESSGTRRVEAEALNKTIQAIENSVSTEGSFNIGIGSIGVTSQFSQNYTEESQNIQKELREYTRKSSDKIKREYKTTVETETDLILEKEELQKVSNPNEEITVTYLLYELERRYKVASRLHQVQPVICVALDMPAPHELTEAWLIEHSWVLGQYLLDPDLESALAYLEEDRAGDLLELELRRRAYNDQLDRTKELQREYSALADHAQQRRAAVVEYMREIGLAEARANAASGGRLGRVGRFIATGGASEIGPGPGDDEALSADLLEARRDAAEQALEYLQQEMERKKRDVSQAQETLAEATENYSEALQSNASREAAIARLQVHVRDNIYHYMHKIWAHEHGDERFFSLYDIDVPFFETPEDAYTLSPGAKDNISTVPGARERGDAYTLTYDPPKPPSQEDVKTEKLGKIANLDQPMGFRGNYAIFPLRECNQLTDGMIFPYIDTYNGVRDPAYGYAYTGEELLQYAKTVWNDLNIRQQNELGDMIVNALIEFPDASQEVTLPTGRLFMEALKGDVALLEDFKLAHRGLDVVSVEEDIRGERIDALRRAQRIAEGELEIDPSDVEKFVVVRNGKTNVDV